MVSQNFGFRTLIFDVWMDQEPFFVSQMMEIWKRGPIAHVDLKLSVTLKYLYRVNQLALTTDAGLL